LTELLSKPSVLLMAWFLMLVVTLLPSWPVLSELVEPRAVRAAPATSLSIVVAVKLIIYDKDNKA
jgi:hypothetical protein